MKLLYSSRSPFTRKVMAFAHEAGLVDRLELERVVTGAAKPNPVVMAHNPLNKIPTLILGSGEAIFDSRVICEYLDGLHNGAKLFPTDAARRRQSLRWQALGDGLMDNLVLRMVEKIRLPGQQSQTHADAYLLKTAAALDMLERESSMLLHERPCIGAIALGSALGYMDFRFFDDGWREGRTGLAAWYAALSARPSFADTIHVDAR